MKVGEIEANVRHIRAELRRVRTGAGLTQQDVADRISALLELPRRLTSAAVGQWELSIREPSIPFFAMWAASLGRRLVLELDDEVEARVPVLVRPEDVETVRALGLLDAEDRDLVVRLVRRISQGET